MKKLIACLLLASSAVYGQTGVLYHDNCEQAPIFGQINGTQAPSFWSWQFGNPAKSQIAVSDSFSRAGNSSYRFNLQRDFESHLSSDARENYLVYNFVPAGTNATYASNAGQPAATSRPSVSLKWMAMSTYLPVWYRSDNNREPIGFVLFSIPESFGPAQYLEIHNGRYVFHTMLWQNNINNESVIDLGPIQQEVWEDWVLERNYTNADSGFVRFYRNGQLVVNLSGGNWPPAGTGYSVDPYVLQGMLQLGWSSPLAQEPVPNQYPKAIYYDEFKFGNDQATLQDFLFAQPVPVPPPPKDYLFYDNVELPGMPFPTYSLPTLPTERWSWYNGFSGLSFLSQTQEFARAGNYSYKFHLKNGTGNGDFNTLKSELVWNFLPAGSPLGTEGNNEAFYRNPLNIRWMAYSTLIPSYNNDFNTVTGIGLTVKSVPDNYTTPSFLAMEEGRYWLWITPINSQNQPQRQIKYDCGPIVKDQWEDWVLHRNFTNSDTGFIELYKNGERVVNHLGGNWVQDVTHSKEPYLVVGLYKWTFADYWREPIPDVNEVTLFVDEIKFGDHSMTLADFTVNEQPNLAPTVSAGPDQSMNIPATRTSLAGTAADLDGTIYARAWRKIGGPAGGDISDSLSLTPTLFNLQQGTYTYQLVVRDNNNQESSDSVVINVGAPLVTMVQFNQFGGGSSAAQPMIWAGGPSTNSIAVSTSQVLSGNYAVQLTIGPNSNGAFLALDTDPLLEFIYSPGQIWVAIAMGRIYIGDYTTGPSYFLTNQTVRTGDFVRIVRVNDQLTVQFSADNGVNWSSVYTFQYRSTSNMWVKATFDNVNARMYYPSIYTGNAFTQLQATASANSPATNLAVIPESVTNNTSIHPNPAKTWITVNPGVDISKGRLKIRIFDIQGKMVQTDATTVYSINQEFKLNISDLKTGTYIIQITDDKGNRIQKKLIKE